MFDVIDVRIPGRDPRLLGYSSRREWLSLIRCNDEAQQE
jgi:hypothetical protein